MNPPLIQFLFFGFADAEDLKRVKELRESRDGEFVVLSKGLVAECSDGSVIFRFADAEDLKRVKELRESRDGEFGERMEGAIESSELAGESKVLDREMGVDSRDSYLEMRVSKFDAVSEKAVEVVGSKICLESENLDEIEVLGRDEALTEKGTGLEVESEIGSFERDQGTGLKVEPEISLLERDQGSLLEVESDFDSLERDQTN